MFKRQGEFGPEYDTASRTAREGISVMFRDFYPQLPEDFVEDGDSGFITLDDDLLSSDEGVPYHVIDWSIDGDV